ncbi:hypothetical protein ABZ488_17985 [Streptomyces griseus]|uniref:hypothetical protein n=1 Tax=Streptomyces TaxID=1883 RepID=UPI003408135E
MTKKKMTRSTLEVRFGNALHVTVTAQRVPGWLVAALATATGSGLAAWLTSR